MSKQFVTFIKNFKLIVKINIINVNSIILFDAIKFDINNSSIKNSCKIDKCYYWDKCLNNSLINNTDLNKS